jgi:hypothetical protein
MRYKACTPGDIKLLRSRVAGKGPNDLKLMQQRNIQKCFSYHYQEFSERQAKCTGKQVKGF